jgi:hypothetical protein
MAASALFRISRQQLDPFDEAIKEAEMEIAEGWKSDRTRDTIAAKLRGLIRLSRGIPNVPRDLWQSTLDLMRVRGIEDYEETGRELRRAFEKGLHILNALQGLAQTFQQAGGVLQGADELSPMIEEVRQLEARILENWPDFTNQARIDALAELERGECLSANEAFPRIAGVDQAMWLRRVEQRKRTSQS